MGKQEYQKNTADCNEQFEENADIGFDDRERFSGYQDIKPEDILLLSWWTDIYWDHRSEYEGEFLGLIYFKDGEPRAQCFNLTDKKLIINFIEKLKQALVYYKGRAWCHTFYNKNIQ